jgi:hypothetical protein
MSEGAPKKLGPFALAKTVFWSFFGVRRRKDHESDLQLSPVHVVIAALIGGLLFVLTLILIVHLVSG